MKQAIFGMALLVRLGIGLVLVYSALLKVTHPHELLNNVFQYQVLGRDSAEVFAALLPFLEMTLGVAMLSGVCTLGAAGLAAVLFLTFTVGQASALLRGIEADCGCFGAGETVSVVSLLRTAALLAGALLALTLAVRQPVPAVYRGDSASA